MACAVVLDGKRLQMSAGETEQEHILALEQGELMINWEHHRAGLGQAVEITSGADRPAFFSPHQTRLFRAHACEYVGHSDFGVLELGPCAADQLSMADLLMPSTMLDQAFVVHRSHGMHFSAGVRSAEPAKLGCLQRKSNGR